MHELISIKYFYDKSSSRVSRYLSFYLKLCIVFALTSLVSTNETFNIEIVLVSIVISALTSFPVTLMTKILNA